MRTFNFKLSYFPVFSIAFLVILMAGSFVLASSLFLACNREPKNVQTRSVLLSMYNSNDHYEPYYVEFPNLKTFNLHPSNFILYDSVCLLNTTEQITLDSFLQIMMKDIKDVSYVHQPDIWDGYDDKYRTVRIDINTEKGKKSIYIFNKNSPPVYSSFANWVTSLRAKYLTSE